ncbi:MAG: glycosyltransferase family 2 protein [Planctomycetota bacterium]|nr:glycosyltransferase family 2 protein [Planctomycetota bacterium]
MKRLCVIVLNYRRAEMTIECLRSLVAPMSGRPDRCAVVVDNGSGDDSADRIGAAIDENGWSDWARLIPSPVNGGFAAGNNIGFGAETAQAYLLLNSDARLRPDTIDHLLASMDRHPEAGLIGPRLEGPDGEPQVSCFRYRTPISEMLVAAGTSLFDRLFSRFIVAAGLPQAPAESDWVSFACILIRREVIDQIGPMDEQYFMYFEDIDYARRARAAGWRVLYDPSARAVHLRGGTSSVKSAMKTRARVPKYYYESRSRYFAKFYGGAAGLILTNMLWLAGRSVAFARELVGHKRPHACQGEFVDNWTNWLDPLRPPSPAGGGEL